MHAQYEFSFDRLLRLEPGEPTAQPYAEWFRQEAIRYAQAAVRKIEDVWNFRTAENQGEAWGDRFNPEYELRRAMATLRGLEERLANCADHFNDAPEVQRHLQEAAAEVHQLRKQAKEHFKRSMKWF